MPKDNIVKTEAKIETECLKTDGKLDFFYGCSLQVIQNDADTFSLYIAAA